VGVDAEHRRLVNGVAGHAFAAAGAEAPVIQAPMAGAGGVELAVAAIRGSAVGSLPCALLGADAVIEQVAAVRAAAAGPLNLNFFCHTLVETVDDSAWRQRLAPYYAEYGVGPPETAPALRRPFDAAMAEVVETVRPEIVSFHFGLPEPALLDRVKASGALVLSSATSVAEARWLAARGVDIVIAQGFEAGGHSARFLPAPPGTEVGLFALLPQIVDAVDVPVIAAGGIADARGIAAAFALGASAVQLGTAYLHTPEATIGAAHRALLRGDAAEVTRFTNVISGRLARGLPNRLIEEVGPVSADAPPFPHASTALAELKKAAEAQGRTDFSTMWSGQAARLGVPEAADTLTRRIVTETLAVLARL
jgi:nitronate monooxygenase